MRCLFFFRLFHCWGRPFAGYLRQVVSPVAVFRRVHAVKSLALGCGRSGGGFRRWCWSLSAPLLLGACQSHYGREPLEVAPLPDHWQTDQTSFNAELAWQDFIDSPQLDALVEQALANNLDLQQQRQQVAIARYNLEQNRMAFWPELSVGLTGSRQSIDGTGLDGESLPPARNNFTLGADLSYELNLWGQLSDAKRAAALAYAAAQSDWLAAQRALVTEVALAWLDVVEAHQLLALYNDRLAILEQNLSTIEAGYRSGLNTALEVYLTRNDVEGGRAAYVDQQQALADRRRALALLLGGYGHLKLPDYTSFPTTAQLLPPQLPSQVLAKRPDLQAAWLRVLRQNADLAVAHKARFPSLRLTADTGYSSNELNDLVSGDPGWSVGGSLLMPLLASGRLKAGEDIARAQLQQTEDAYRATVYQAFAEVESALQNQASLQRQYDFTQQSADNAEQAEKLAFDQYLRGLVNYTTFLEAQSRAVDAEIRLITLRRQAVGNKIRLHEALGGQWRVPLAANEQDVASSKR